MKNRLETIFSFLKKNRKYNKEIQTKFHRTSLAPYESKFAKLISLLYNTANTQSQPKIDLLAHFYKTIHQNPLESSSMKGFINIISPTETEEVTYQNLFENLKKQKGWGQKTSALFVKNIFHLHSGNYPTKFKIWDDAPNSIQKNDKIYLPVDRVIITIFKELQEKSWTFKSINDELSKFYSGDEIEIWDDLWFWGFVSTKGSGTNRSFQWNENKYWNLKETSKQESRIKEIQSKAIQFIELINKKTKT